MAGKEGKDTDSECVKVVVRCRPLNSKERGTGERSIVTCDAKMGQILIDKVEEPGAPPKVFSFDNVYAPDSSQKKIWEQTAKSIVDSVIEGYNGTIFAYGQTGTGKTFTMEGVIEDPNLRGIMPNAFHYIMEEVQNSASNVEFLVRTSFLEIYNDQVYDLLAKKREKKEVREKRNSFGQMEVFVKDLKHYVVKSVDDMMRILLRGQKLRKTGATGMNAGSSRSHSIFTVAVESCETNAEGKKMFKVGRLNMVDLAGSERQKKTGASGERLVEGNSINVSLSALGNVIKALVSKKAKHIPFRDSKLTRLLQNSLGGNTKTVMVANVGPAGWNYEETMSTLRYAYRAKAIKNKPRVNEDPKDAMLKKCQDEIEALRRQLEAAKNSTEGGYVHVDPTTGEPVPVQEMIEEKTVIKEVVHNTGLTAEDKKKAEAEILEKHRQQRKVDEDMARVMALRHKGNEEAAQKLEKELEAKHKKIEEEKQRLEAIQKKLNEKAKLLMKGQKTLEAARIQREKLKKAEEAISKRREEEMKIREQLEKAKEKELLLEEKYANRQDEMKKKTEKLKELFSRYREKQRDLADLQEEWQVERVDLVENIRALDQQIRLRDLILKHYVPDRWLKEIEDRSHYNEATDEWVIPGVQYAANNVVNDIRKGVRQEANNDYARQLARRFRRHQGPFDPLAAEAEEPLDVNETGGKMSNPYFSYGVDLKKRRKRKSKSSRKRRT
mmetsp:Transcript_7236/g.13472  ORF Transcript_7236/g.13472 Transcript_7236/m.13472 type:complete len:723 (-) Transcript_7236:164-2332(-)|eukprot:CAMPEP_0197521282 /NCGR_PEP_ID=MMETSP1318-20131121/6555_1 /TAXON_ID=552666 /ORGANISM="Partenskyella glossopodia, Strain RCC365" /LENGTH=722 /DNA_ID=CAMNT_0043073189 /DNA_START=38 /DNA_END=2206 /DNA_ORIENTATION=-